MKFFVLQIGFLFLILFSCWTCNTGPTSPQEIIFPDKNISYAKHIQPLFDLSCTTSGCHGESAAGGVKLVSYVNLFQTAGLVLPQDSLNSTLAMIVSQRLPHSVVLIQDLTTANQRKGVSQWIYEGASNN